MKRPNILFFSGRGNYLNCTQRHRDTELFVIVIVIVKTLCVFVSLCTQIKEKTKNTTHFTKFSRPPLFTGVPASEVLSKHITNTSPTSHHLIKEAPQNIYLYDRPLVAFPPLFEGGLLISNNDVFLWKMYDG